MILFAPSSWALHCRLPNRMRCAAMLLARHEHTTWLREVGHAVAEPMAIVLPLQRCLAWFAKRSVKPCAGSHGEEAEPWRNCATFCCWILC